MTHARTSVAYLLKAFPLLSETFISSEIRRVEASGVQVRIFVIKPRDQREHHPVVDRIHAQPSYLPPTRRLSEVSRTWWLITNVPPFVPSLFRTARRHPAGVLRAVSWALRESITARRSAWSWPKISYIRDLLLAVALADRVLKCADVGHLHAHFAHETTTIAWLTSLITDLPFSFTAHAKDIYSQRINPESLLRRKLSAASFVVTCTDANRKHLGEMVNGTPVHRIYHGLNDDFSRFLEGKPPPAVEAEVMRLLTVGRLVAKKGFDILVEACGILRERDIEFDAEIVGEDDDIGDGIRVGDDLRRRIARLGLEERVRLLGQLGQAEVYERYCASGIFCLPCRVLSNGDRDGIPNVLVEAMACGVPVVTTPVSGIPELIHDGVNGLLVPPDDPAALADALLLLHRDRELGARLARAGRETVRTRFDGDHLASQLAGLFKQVIV